MHWPEVAGELRTRVITWLMACACFCGGFDAARAQDGGAKGDPPEAPQIDPATKKLLAAHGLSHRGLFKLAAPESEDFLAQFRAHAEAPTARYALAVCRYRLNQPAETEKTLARLLESHADSRHALDATLLRGQCLEASGELASAAEQYRRFVETAPAARKADGQYSLGVVLFKAGKHDESIRVLARLTGDDARDNLYAAPARLQLGLVQLAAGKSADARKTLEKLVASDSERKDAARYALAHSDVAERKWDAARQTLDELASRQPPPANLPQVLLDPAACAAELNQHDKAAAELEQFLARHAHTPQAAEAAYRQALSLHKLGRYEQSSAAARRVNEVQ